jgi:hypothetical protein
VGLESGGEERSGKGCSDVEDMMSDEGRVVVADKRDSRREVRRSNKGHAGRQFAGCIDGLSKVVADECQSTERLKSMVALEKSHYQRLWAYC